MTTDRRLPPGVEVRQQQDGTTSYRAWVWDPRGRRKIRRTFTTRTAAKQWRRDALTAVARGDLTPATRTPRVNEALDDLLEGMRDGRVLTRSGESFKAGTCRTYGYAIRDVLKPRLGHLRLHEVRRRDVQAVVDGLREDGVAASTIRSTLDPLRVLYRRAIREDLLTVTPCANLDLPAVRPARKEALAPDAVEALLAALPDSDRALWATAFYAGLRRGELRALRWSHVDLDGAVLYVRHSWDDVEGQQTPKSYMGVRDVLILPVLAREIARHGLLTGGTGDDLVFGTTGSRPFSTTSVARRARRVWTASREHPHAGEG